MITPVLTKHPNEMFPIGLEYISPDIDEGESVVSVSVSINPSAVDGLKTSGTPNIKNGTTVMQMIYDGLDGREYTVKFLTVTSVGHIYEDSIFVKVRE